jgi:uncharacterized membrane protein YbjE (DUF340 family)
MLLGFLLCGTALGAMTLNNFNLKYFIYELFLMFLLLIAGVPGVGRENSILHP